MDSDLIHSINKLIIDHYYLTLRSFQMMDQPEMLRNHTLRLPDSQLRVFLHLNGRMSYQVDGEKVDVQPEEVLLVGHGLWVSVDRAGQMSRLQVAVIGMELNCVSAAMPEANLPTWYHRPIPEMFWIRDILRRLALAYDRIALQSLALAEMSLRLSHEERRVRAKNSIMGPILELIDERRGVDVALPELAALVHLSPRQLQRIFRQETGMSPKEYCINVRVNSARALLHDDSMRVHDVAEALGYSSQFAFSRQFTRVVGCSPKQYQKRAPKL